LFIKKKREKLQVALAVDPSGFTRQPRSDLQKRLLGFPDAMTRRCSSDLSTTRCKLLQPVAKPSYGKEEVLDTQGTCTQKLTSPIYRSSHHGSQDFALALANCLLLCTGKLGEINDYGSTHVRE
jgi:hypothetical protein